MFNSKSIAVFCGERHPLCTSPEKGDRGSEFIEGEDREPAAICQEDQIIWSCCWGWGRLNPATAQKKSPIWLFLRAHGGTGLIQGQEILWEELKAKSSPPLFFFGLLG
jgi:hypothetical protein